MLYNIVIIITHYFTEFSLVQLDINFNKISEINDYKINDSLISECTKFYFSSLLYLSNEFYLLSNCDKGNFNLIKYEVEKEYIDLITMKSNIPKNSIKIKMNKILSYIQIGNSYKIKGNDYIIKISLLIYQFYSKF